MHNASTAKADRARAEAQDFCAVCEKTVWVSFYFDAFGHNKELDGEHISNIGKLWRASKHIPDKGVFSNYYAGLGTPYNPELSLLALAKWEYDRQAKKAKDATKNALTKPDAAIGFAKSVAKTAAESSVSSESKGWWQNIQHAVKTQIATQTKGIHQAINIVFKPKARQRWLRGIQREWLHFAEDLAYHPWRATKTVFAAIGKEGAKNTIEKIPLIRDAEWVSILFNTGVDTRLVAAEADFKLAVFKTRYKAADIKHINIAVFGADMGCAIAIAFINKLMQTTCVGGRYEGLNVHVKFMGLLDCVTARFDDNFATSFIPLSNSVSDDLKIPKAVQKIVHYAAAHEQRGYKPLSSIGGSREFGGRLEERLFPGAQEDVIGGYRDNEEGISNQLSRMPLQMMLGRAWRFGVPITPLEKLERSTDVYIDVYPLFKMDDRVRPLVYAYWKQALALTSTVKQVQIGVPTLDTRSQDEKLHDAELDKTVGLNGCIIPHIENITSLPKDMQAELAGHAALYMAWLKSCCSNHEANAKLGVSLTHSRKLDFYELNKEADEMFRRAHEDGMEMSERAALERSFAKIWSSLNSEILNEDLTYLFNAYVHDSLADSAIARIASGLFNMQSYLSTRRISPLGQEEDQGVFERWFTLPKSPEGKTTKSL